MKLHISSVRLYGQFSFNPSIPTYWHEEQPSGCSLYAQLNELFKQYLYIFAYLPIMLEVSWHITEGN